MVDRAEPVLPKDLAADAVHLVRSWLSESRIADARTVEGGEGARLLAGLLGEEGGLSFTRDFVDGVARPEDPFVAAVNFNRLAARAPGFLPLGLRLAVRAGGVASLTLPWAVIPLARGTLRRLVGHLVVDAPADGPAPLPDARPDPLARALTRLRSAGSRPNITMLGEPVLGETEARRRVANIRALCDREDVDFVSFSLSSVASNLTMWGWEEAVDRVVARLIPLLEHAGRTGTFLSLDAEEYRDLQLATAVFRRLMDRPEMRGMGAGLTLQAYLPDSYDALVELTEWAQQRVASGGAPVRVRIVKGANLAMERVDSTLNGWPLAPFSAKIDTDANFKRMLEWALRPEHVDAVHVGVASHNLFDIALSWLLASRRDVLTVRSNLSAGAIVDPLLGPHGTTVVAPHTISGGDLPQMHGITSAPVEWEVLLGMAPGHIRAVGKTVGGIRVYTPVVKPSEFEAAVGYLVRQLDESAHSENFLSAIADIEDDTDLFERERNRFLDSISRLDGELPSTNRTQNRQTEWREDDRDSPLYYRTPDLTDPGQEAGGLTAAVLGLTRGSGGDTDEQPVLEPAAVPDQIPVVSHTGLAHEPNTDPSIPANREWAAGVLGRVGDSTIGSEGVVAAVVHTVEEADAAVTRVSARGVGWGAQPVAERAAVLRRVALSLIANRDRLVEVMVAETGMTIADADPEVSYAVDAARYYAARGTELHSTVGARFLPCSLIAVAASWESPIAAVADGVLAALAAGSGVLLVPHSRAERSAAVLAGVLWEAGVPRELCGLGVPKDAALRDYLLSHPGVGRLLFRGDWEEARAHERQHPESRILAQSDGVNAITVTPSADVSQAVTQIVASAYGRSGQSPSAASLVILVGSMARSKRFLRQLEDAVRALRVGVPTDPATQVGPLGEPATGAALDALTVLAGGESWLVEPERVDAEGTLWSPGVKAGVRKGSTLHLNRAAVPVVGILHAFTLTEAIEIHNAVGSGLTAGLHSLDAEEIGVWVDNVHAATLYVNRAITPPVVERRPGGGWKHSRVGPGGAPGGPNYLFALGEWESLEGEQSSTLHLRGLSTGVTALIEAAQLSLDYQEFDLLRRAALSDALLWGTEFGRVRDVSRLGIERNLLRYWPADAQVRMCADGSLTDLLRVLAAATLARASLTVSSARPLPTAIMAVLAEEDVPVSIESDDDWYERLAIGVPGVRRIRLLGGDRDRLARSVVGHPGVSVYANPVTNAGRLELLPFVREQVISVAAHRFGTPAQLTDTLF
ncbi:bifunctional proline dehydrogenase/L-glutamate gamma-semialdehyde dehydrogenase [Klugiella xanthotipulae]|uniref:L-proline dehydrogenase n=1 Tax=Klugiella xanthotipulae TaxID=244735 RepID=A0A543HGZ9_9MICO|nr:bifunctional proline dehydrogenase/L-glutamate gamma-semialdehyde dehydrogenase [Klugiella xanthotipulae]TQM57567.1 L-proline dehydrogenase [Klugiella xanthotipulae]